MKTSVLGIRLNDIQREKLRAIGTDNRMGEVEIARFLIEKAIDGTIIIEHGTVRCEK
jgi:hypothetical protein